MIATRKDVAKLARVSLTTVSHTLNNTPGARIKTETRKRVLQVAEQLGYQPNVIARNLRLQKSHNIGVIILHDSKSYALTPGTYVFQILRSIADAVRETGYNQMLFFENNFKELDYRSLFKEKRVDGLMIVDATIADLNKMESELGKYPIIFISNHKKGTKLNYVDIDNAGGVYQAIEHLIKLGHKRIAFVSWADFMSRTNYIERLNAYKEALTKNNLKPDPELIYGNPLETEKNYYGFAKKLLSKPDCPTAIFAAADGIAMGTVKSIRQYGLSVPEDIALIGFDDIETAEYFIPSLTTVRQPIYEVGRVAVQELIGHLNGDHKQTRKIFETELIVRESCGAKLKSAKRKKIEARGGENLR